MTDPLDAASLLTERERDAVIERHKARTTAALPMCEECEEQTVHVTTRGTRWRYCITCAEEFLRRGAGA